MAGSKKRVIKSLETLSEDLRELMRQQYPTGYEGSITRIVNAKREPIFVFPLETEEAIYLIKLPATKNSDGEYDVEPAEKEEFKTPKAERGPAGADDDFDSTDDNFERESEEESSNDDDYDEERSNKRGREASYDPDFDG
jgi:hypothetical protein